MKQELAVSIAKLQLQADIEDQIEELIKDFNRKGLGERVTSIYLAHNKDSEEVDISVYFTSEENIEYNKIIKAKLAGD